MRTPLELANMRSLMTQSAGEPEIVIGLVDGPIDVSHPALKDSQVVMLSPPMRELCQSQERHGCRHGTFIAGILCANRNSSAPAICPNCTLLTKPIFYEAHASQQIDHYASEELASAIIELVDAGAKIINLSIGLLNSDASSRNLLKQAFEYAFRRQVMLVAASGNQGHVGDAALALHPWVVSVAACDGTGNLQTSSNIGASIAKSGLRAPGVNIKSISSNGEYTQMSGTSVAAPFVTGLAALLWSLFPRAAAADVRRAVLLHEKRRQSIIPILLNGEASWRALSAYR